MSGSRWSKTVKLLHGRGRGLKIVSKQSIFDEDYPVLLNLIINRVAILYELLRVHRR